jgi:hypothetical protein
MEINLELGINKQTFYNWKKKHTGMSGEHLRQLKQLQEENQRLKQMYADVSLDWKNVEIDPSSSEQIDPTPSKLIVAKNTQCYPLVNFTLITFHWHQLRGSISGRRWGISLTDYSTYRWKISLFNQYLKV